jgi:hypothetical protein
VTDTETNIVAAIAGLIGGLVVFLLGRRKLPFSSYGDGPVLSSYGLLEGDIVGAANNVMIEGYKAHFFANTNGRSMIYIELGRNTKLHTITVGDKSDLRAQLNSRKARKFLTPVTLEGDFPDHMSMFCTSGYELELVQLFDPSDMAYFVDFCRAYDFEIYHDALYIAQGPKTMDENDTTTMSKDVEVFLKRNKPWLDRVGNSVQVAQPEVL